jgi:hypothetical protein
MRFQATVSQDLKAQSASSNAQGNLHSTESNELGVLMVPSCLDRAKQEDHSNSSCPENAELLWLRY